MQYAKDFSGVIPNVWKPMSLVIAVGVGLGLVVAGSALALGLGIGLHNTSGNLTIITVPTTTTTTTTTTVTTTTITTTTATTTTTITTATTTTLISDVYQGNLTTSSASYYDATTSTLYYYDTTDVIVDATGNYTLQSSSASSLSLNGYLYNNSFSALSPSTNLLARTDQSIVASSTFTITYNLLFGVEYVLMVLTVNQNVTGTFNITATGPGITTFVRRTTVTISAVYGTVSNSGTDDTSNGRVQINAQDVITGVDGVTTMGYVDQVYFSFSTAPSTTTPMIYLYVMNQTSTLVFTSTVVYQIPYASITIGTTGVQNISLPLNQLSVVSGQYIGVGFSTGGGSLYSVSGRSQYYLSGVTTFATTGSATYLTTTTGFAFSFRVKTVAVVYG